MENADENGNVNENKELSFLKEGIVPYDHQLKALKFIKDQETDNTMKYGWSRSTRGGILNLKMGLGKTLIGILASFVYKRDNPTLIVCPPQIMVTWKDEVEKFLNKKCRRRVLFVENEGDIPEKGFKRKIMVITTYTFLRTTKMQHFISTENNSGQEIHIPSIPSKPLKKEGSGKSLFYSIEWGRIICDEGHNVNSPTTDTYRALMALCSNNRWVLTGTLVRNPPLDPFGALRFIGFTGVDTPGQWKKHAARHMDSFSINNHILKMSIEDAGITLPSKTVHIVEVELGKTQKRAYDYIKQNAEKEYEDYRNNLGGTYAGVLASILYMRMASIAPGMVKEEKEELYFPHLNDVEENWLRRASSTANMGAKKIRTAVDILKKLDNCLVFSTFRDSIDYLISACKRKKDGIPDFSYAVLRGGMTPTEKAESVHDFNSGRVRFLFSTLKTGSEGLNLAQGTCNVLRLDPWWTPAVEEQADSRVHRNGQTRPVNVWVLIAKQTIEERMFQLGKEKREKEGDMLDGCEHLEKEKKLTKSDLAYLFKNF